MLRLEGVRSGYGKGEVLHGIDLTVGQGEVVAVLGPNGAGKSTLLRTIAGLMRIRSGALYWDDQKMRGYSSVKAVTEGIVLVPEGRQIFASLTVKENLLLGAFSRKRDESIAADIERMYEHFPILREKQDDRGSAMSGGQQQMLAIARGLMARPRLLLLDEPSLGLSPVIVDTLGPLITQLVHDFSTSVLVVEQNASLALSVAERAYLIQSGRVEVTTTAAEMREMLESDNLYLGGVSGEGHRVAHRT
jgi:branched-chain amino acid transport system ATP-binding protein